MLDQRELDFARVHPIAADLDLIILSSEKLETSIGSHASDIAGAVSAYPTVGGIALENRARELRLAPVP